MLATSMRQLALQYLALDEGSWDKVDTLRKTCVAPHRDLSTRTPTHNSGCENRVWACRRTVLGGDHLLLDAFHLHLDVRQQLARAHTPTASETREGYPPLTEGRLPRGSKPASAL